MNYRNERKIKELEKYRDNLLKEVADEKEAREKGRLRQIISTDITNLKEDMAHDISNILGGGIDV